VIERIQRTLDAWSRGRSRERIQWDRIEDLHYQLAKASDYVAVEASDSERWRLVFPDAAVVHCLPVFHNDAWHLTTSVHSVDRPAHNVVGGADHWTRAMVWTIAVAKALEPYGVEGEKAVADLRHRMSLQRELQSIADELRPTISRAYEQVMGSPLEWPSFSIGASSAPLSVGKVGLSVPPGKGRDYTVISVHPKAFARPAYLREIVRHELIHTVIDPALQSAAHDEVFRQLATAAGLPKRYQD